MDAMEHAREKEDRDRDRDRDREKGALGECPRKQESAEGGREASKREWGKRGREGVAYIHRQREMNVCVCVCVCVCV